MVDIVVNNTGVNSRGVTAGWISRAALGGADARSVARRTPDGSDGAFGTFQWMI